MPLKLLALETTGLAGSVALAEDGRPIVERPLTPGQRSAQSLAPGIRQLLDDAGWAPAELGLVAVVTGPGSFTGLRVGVATAKTLAYALKIDVLGLNSLEVIAAQVGSHPASHREGTRRATQKAARESPCDQPPTSLSPVGERAGVRGPASTPPLTSNPATPAPPHGGPSPTTLEVILDAQRRELFRAQFALDSVDPSTGPRWLSPEPGEIVTFEAWLSSLAPGSQVSGPASEKLGERLPETVQVAPRESWFPRAATVARLAWNRWLAGERDDLWRLAPLYLRPSAAEERRRRPQD